MEIGERMSGLLRPPSSVVRRLFADGASSAFAELRPLIFDQLNAIAARAIDLQDQADAAFVELALVGIPLERHEIAGDETIRARRGGNPGIAAQADYLREI